MIKSIKELSVTDRPRVLKALHDMGMRQNNHYIRYSYTEFEHLCSFLSSCEHDIGLREGESLLNQFNDRETRIYRLMMNSPLKAPTTGDLKIMTDRTRSAIKRILKSERNEAEQAQIPVETRLQKLKQAIFN